MRVTHRLVARAATFAAFAAVAIVGATVAQDAPFQWNIPAPFPRPPVPADNAMSVAKVELGRLLFYDPRLSGNGTQSCASCHRQELAFTDGLPIAEGSTGVHHPRGSMSLANVAYNPSLTWADTAGASLEKQAMVPMLGTDPVEMGLGGSEQRVMRDLSRDTLYRRMFAKAFPDVATTFTLANVTRAIAAFERTMISMQSPYDRYRYGNDSTAISASAKRGEQIFFSGQRGSCFQCHGGWNFSGHVRYEGHIDARSTYFNTGLYNVVGATSYPGLNTGIHRQTKRATDIGKFRAPTLRNIAVTAPYMHDGSIPTLGEVLDHYAAGGRTISAGANAGVGRDNPNKAPNVRGFSLTDGDKADLIAFLETLTDTTFLRNPALANPWKKVR